MKLRIDRFLNIRIDRFLNIRSLYQPREDRTQEKNEIKKKVLSEKLIVVQIKSWELGI